MSVKFEFDQIAASLCLSRDPQAGHDFMPCQCRDELCLQSGSVSSFIKRFARPTASPILRHDEFAIHDRDGAVVEHQLRWLALDWWWHSLEKAVGGG